MDLHQTLPGSTSAFSRTDLVLLLAITGLAAAVAGCFVVGSKREAQANHCTANLKEITLGFNLWMNDTEANFLPWGTSYPSGNRELPEALRRNSWFQFRYLSNSIKSPSVLADPADKRRGLRPASSWTAGADGGFFHPSYQNNACSYALLLDVGLSNRMLPLDSNGNQILALDRHFNDSGKRGDCTFDFHQVPSYPPGTQVRWTREVHGTDFGNLAFQDGSVNQVRAPELAKTVPGMWDWRDDSAHYLLPTLSSR